MAESAATSKRGPLQAEVPLQAWEPLLAVPLQAMKPLQARAAKHSSTSTMAIAGARGGRCSKSLRCFLWLLCANSFMYFKFEFYMFCELVFLRLCVVDGMCLSECVCICSFCSCFVYAVHVCVCACRHGHACGFEPLWLPCLF